MPYPAFVNRSLLPAALAFVAVLATLPAQAQTPARQAAPQQLAPPKAYKAVAVTVAAPSDDPTFAAFRKQLGEIAAKKDRAALAKLVVADGFFWVGDKGDKADKAKSSMDNLAAAVELDGKEGFGWEALAAAANEPTLQEVPERKGVLCSPAVPLFDVAAAEAIAKDTGTDPIEWAYANRPEVEVRGAAKADAPVIDKLGQTLVRMMPEQLAAGTTPQEQPFVRVVTPAGKVGYVNSDHISLLGSDQICYVKDGSTWKITGYAGNDSP
jgi:hypothetical protein